VTKANFRYRSPFNFDLSKMSVEEAKERLRSHGIPVDEWVDNEGRVEEGEKAQLPTLKFYADMLSKIGDLVGDQVQRDVKEIDDLNYQLRRLKHGGGR
jgi:hypothetical protein